MQQRPLLVPWEVEGVAGSARDHGPAGRGPNVVAQASGLRIRLPLPRDPGPRAGGVGVAGVPADRIGDGAVAGAAAEVALQVAGQVLLLVLIERRCGHHHACGAEAALKALAFHELVLDRMQLPLGTAGGGCQPLDGGDRVPLGADGGIDAAVDRGPVHVHGAGAAVPAVASLLHTRVALLAQDRPQALPRTWVSAGMCSVDLDSHAQAPFGSVVVAAAGPSPARGGQKSPETGIPCASAGVASSARISSASRYVMSRRQAGSPWMSSW